jgi:SAM-dependent methyltransferase
MPSLVNPGSHFQKYSAFYDLLYRDKDYVAEADFVARMIRRETPDARSILELGSGTGRHGHLLAALGFKVHGIEQSAEMASIARAAEFGPSSATAGSFTCEIGDICTAKVGITFDAVIALFHVMSYQTTDEALRAAFQVAADHLCPGGLFLFDVWHGPAVLAQRPSERVKEMEDDRYRVRRTARPELDASSNTVKVVYHMSCEDRCSGERSSFSEEHRMRYVFPTEVELLAKNCGLRCLRTEEFLTGREPSPSTWGVFYLLQR